MRDWKHAGVEPTIDELLGDEVMVPVLRSAGLCVGDLRALVAETAGRLNDERDWSRRRAAD
jgi:hypothetical protein